MFRWFRCKKCLLPNTHPYINFDEDGICNYCNSYIPKKYEGIDALKELVDKIKSEQNRYDCLVGLSGGRDSSYVAYKCVKEFDMNVLGYSYNNGSMTESARENVKKISEKLDIKTIVIDKEAGKNSRMFKKNFLAWAKKPSAGMIPKFCIGCKWGYKKYSYLLMKKYNINYLADGGNFYENTYHKLGFLGFKNVKDVTISRESSRTEIFPFLYAILKEVIQNPYFLNPSIFIDDIKCFRMTFSRFAPGKSLFKPLMYEKYDEGKIINTITNEFNWEKPSYSAATWRSDCKVAMLKNYCYFKMVGFSDYDAMLSNMIRDRIIDRKLAMSKIGKYNNFDITFINDFLESKGIDSLNLHNAIKLWRKYAR